MESCLSHWEDGLPPPNKILWGADQEAPIMKNREHRSAGAAAADEELESVQNPLLLEKLISQQLSACNSSWSSFRMACTSAGTMDNEEEPTSGNKLCASCGDTEKRAVIRRTVKDGGTSTSSSGCMKRSASAAMLSANGAENVAAAARVRARRGEATDQHSLAERTRRTKITVRMRALHRLIPDASKTNKASMLEEVFQYVSMLQARLKMECTTKLDSRGEALSTMCPNVPIDIEGWRKNCNRVFVNKMIERVLDPQEERLAEAERQVLSRLSHPSSHLSFASTYLSSLGLSLIPISHLPSSPSNPSASRI